MFMHASDDDNKPSEYSRLIGAHKIAADPLIIATELQLITSWNQNSQTVSIYYLYIERLWRDDVYLIAVATPDSLVDDTQAPDGDMRLTERDDVISTEVPPAGFTHNHITNQLDVGIPCSHLVNGRVTHRQWTEMCGSPSAMMWQPLKSYRWPASTHNHQGPHFQKFLGRS